MWSNWLFAILAAFLVGGVAGGAAGPAADNCDTACRDKKVFYLFATEQVNEYLVSDCWVCKEGKCVANTDPDGVTCDKEIAGPQTVWVWAVYPLCYYTPGVGISYREGFKQGPLLETIVRTGILQCKT